MSFGEVEAGEWTHSTESRRRDLLVRGVSGKCRNSFVGDMLALRPGVMEEGTRVPFKFANARGSMLLRLLWPPRGTSAVSTEYGASSSHLFSRSQLQKYQYDVCKGVDLTMTYSNTQPTPTQLTTPPVSLAFSRVLFPPSLNTT